MEEKKVNKSEKAKKVEAKANATKVNAGSAGKRTQTSTGKKPVRKTMRKSEKRMILILILILVIVIVAWIVIRNRNNETTRIGTGQTMQNGTSENSYADVLEDGSKVNVSSKLKQDKEIEGLKITNIEVTEVENVTTLVATVKNETSEKKGGYPVNIKVLDDKGNEIITVGGYISEVEAGGEQKLDVTATFDFSSAYDIEITKK